MDIHARVAVFLQELAARYPNPATHLEAANPWELLVATVLSAQCTDKRVNMVTPALFSRWPSPAALAVAELEAVEECIRSTGFFRNKAKNIIGAAQKVMQEYGGSVPATMEDLIRLPGVARKTANVVLWGAFGHNEGLAVDTHVGRIALRLGFTQSSDPERAERDLMALFPREEWGRINHRMVWFGRDVCDARKPACPRCEMVEICPSSARGGRLEEAVTKVVAQSRGGGKAGSPQKRPAAKAPARSTAARKNNGS